MKKVLGIFAFFLLMSSATCSDNNKTEDFDSVELQAAEKEDLLTLREEEKLARDVYLFAYEKYGLPTFSNISESEQNHMEQVSYILQQYGIEDTGSFEKGVFHNEELQKLYDELTEKVLISLQEALVVGATIEDLDINDIQEFKEKTSEALILNMYEALECGSRNHMRAFYGQLVNYGQTYEAQFISQEELETIVNSAKERCSRK